MGQTAIASPDLNQLLLPKLNLQVALLRDGKVVKEYEFSSRSRRLIRIGRQPGVHLGLEDGAVAKCHAAIEMGEGRATLIDLGQTGGTLLNGDRIKKARLKNHDRISVGNSELMVTFGEAEAEARPDTRTRLFFQQLQMSPPEWIPELHRFLEFLTFSRAPAAKPPKRIAPPVLGKPQRLSLHEALGQVEADHDEGPTTHCQVWPTSPEPGRMDPEPAPALTASLEPALADEVDFYDTHRLVTKFRRDRRRVHGSVFAALGMLVVGVAVLVGVHGRQSSAAALAKTATQAALTGKPLRDSEDFAYRRVPAGFSLDKLSTVSWAPPGYSAALARHNPGLPSRQVLAAGTVVKLPRFITHTVGRGDNLVAIAERLLGDRRQAHLIRDANRQALPNPALIEVGLKLRIPVAVPTELLPF